MAHGSEEKTTLVESLAELLGSLFFFTLLSVALPRSEQLLHLVRVSPLVDPPQYDLLIPVSMPLHLPHFHLFFSINRIELAQFRAFLPLEFLDL